MVSVAELGTRNEWRVEENSGKSKAKGNVAVTVASTTKQLQRSKVEAIP